VRDEGNQGVGIEKAPVVPDNALTVRVIRSRRRKRSVSARIVRNVLYVSAPLHIGQQQLEGIIRELQGNIERKQRQQLLNRDSDLYRRAERLNKQYFNSVLLVDDIKYVANQKQLYGCCDFHKRAIRISVDVASMPEWVKDYVVMHELAHLLEPNHSSKFWDMVKQYKYSERARGFLIAKGIERHEESSEG
jgi:predicted metal-dependent hydrolase